MHAGICLTPVTKCNKMGQPKIPSFVNGLLTVHAWTVLRVPACPRGGTGTPPGENDRIRP